MPVTREPFPHASELKLAELEPGLRITASGQWLTLSARNDDNLRFGTVCRIIPGDGTEMEPEYDSLCISGSSVLILAKSFSNSESGEDELKVELERENRSFERMLGEHAELHRKLYFSADLEFAGGRERANEDLLDGAYEDKASPELLEKLWRFGRYLYLSGIGPEPFGLYGLWCGCYEPGWAQHVANENVQMLNWHAVAGNLAELTLPLIHYYCRRMDAFRRNAKKLFGCGGIFVSTYTTRDNSSPMPVVPVTIHFLGCAGWLSRHFLDYYAATGDGRTFRDEILPFMLETAAFYEDYVRYDSDGRLLLYPCVSPENTLSEYFRRNMPDGTPVSGHPMPVTVNATIELAILKELLTSLTGMAGICKLPPERVRVWKRILNAIPAYRVNRDGAIGEWMHPDFSDRYCHRHLSHLYPVFPANEITGENAPELFAAFKRTVTLRKLGGQTGWSLAHMAAIYARFECTEAATNCIDTMAKGCLLRNFFTLHNDFRDMGATGTFGAQEATLQLDALMGAVNAVQEMLFRIMPGEVRFLPALPRRISSGRVKSFRFFGGTANFSWNLGKKQFSVEIKADSDVGVLFRMPPLFTGEPQIEILCGKPRLATLPGGMKAELAKGDVFALRISGISASPVPDPDNSVLLSNRNRKGKSSAV